MLGAECFYSNCMTWFRIYTSDGGRGPRRMVYDRKEMESFVTIEVRTSICKSWYQRRTTWTWTWPLLISVFSPLELKSDNCDIQSFLCRATNRHGGELSDSASCVHIIMHINEYRDLELHVHFPVGGHSPAMVRYFFLSAKPHKNKPLH